MYDTARRVALVKQRVRENTRRRQRRGIYGLSAACMLLFAVLTQTAGTVIGQRRSPRCASGSESGKTRKKTGRTSPTRKNRRRKANEETNT